MSKRGTKEEAEAQQRRESNTGSGGDGFGDSVIQGTWKYDHQIGSRELFGSTTCNNEDRSKTNI